MLKRFWNYIFYFTWRLHCIITLNLFEKPTMRILRIVPYFARNLEKGKDVHRNIVDNPQYGFNIGFAFYCMLTSSNIVVSCFLFCMSKIFYIDLKNDFAIGVFITVLILISYSINRMLLGWEKKEYIAYFKEFSKVEHKKTAYVVTILFHLCAAGIGIFTILIFN